MIGRAMFYTNRRHRLGASIEVSAATLADAGKIAEVHLAARNAAMPYLRRPFTDAETRDWFARVVCNPPGAWWIARYSGSVAGYMLLEGQGLEHLYVHPVWQGRGIGAALLNHAKASSERRIVLWTFQRNARARQFYEAHGFRAVACTAGDNQEGEPDIQYAWSPRGAVEPVASGAG